ncbi:MAG: alkaline phosphatase [Blastochloris sp.]|nr:alkaline phosphatase [Blastochloris sp.]
MIWRQRIVSLFIIGAFTLMAFWYYRYYVAPKPHGVIVFVAPGLSPRLISEYKVKHPELTFISEQATDFTLVDHTALIGCGIDPASIMTYFSTGVTGLANQIGFDPQGNRLDNLLYAAQRAGRLVGIISTDSIVSPHVAAFYAQTRNAQDQQDLARQLFDTTTISSIMGGGASDLTQTSGDKPRNLLQEAALKDYNLIEDQQQLDNLPVWTWRTPWKTRKLLGLFSDKALPYYYPELNKKDDVSPHTPTLRAMTRKSIQCLQFNLNGYFLIVHHGKIETASRENNYPQVLNEIQQLDEAIADARAYAGENTLILLYCPYAVYGLKQVLPNTPPTASTAIRPLTKFVKGKKVPVTLTYPGPFQPQYEFTTYYGWASVYYHTPTNLKGFSTPYDLNQLLSSEF